ncbi:MAG: peptidase M48, Ste24p [uncultured bacterium]|nr:MAG: peptidase M48, Ste24p [uncultured bacterium]
MFALKIKKIESKNLHFALLLLGCLISSVIYAYELPDLGEHSATILSTKEEKQLEKDFMKEVRSRMSILDDAIINDYIQNLGSKLASNIKNRKFTFFIVNDPSINAFAGPGANIGIHSGIFAATRSESELAAVLAHEIAHVSQHHIEHIIERAKNTQITATAGALAALIVGMVTGGSASNIATGATMASMGGAAQHMISFSKDKENEADYIGMRTLYNSGFDPTAMPTFFERMQHLTYDYNSKIPTFLSTHPTTNARIAESKNRASQYTQKQINNQYTYNLVHARLQAITFRSPATAVRYFQNQLTTNRQNDPTALQYGYAIALYQDRQLSQASNIINKLQKKYPEEVLFQIAAAQIAEADKQNDKAISILKTTLTNHPNYYPLFIQYGQTLLVAKQSQEACYFLKSKTIQHSEDAGLYLLLAQAYAQNSQKADAYQARAKAYEIAGYPQQAKVLLQQALKEPKLNPTEKSIIHARIEQLSNIEKNL